MILRYHHLSRYASVFQAMTGLKINLFDEVVADVEPLLRSRNKALEPSGPPTWAWRWANTGLAHP
ncbi:MAG: hypothetical protein U0350_38420 [Caldilineaceae bacterium]